MFTLGNALGLIFMWGLVPGVSCLTVCILSCCYSWWRDFCLAFWNPVSPILLTLDYCWILPQPASYWYCELILCFDILTLDCVYSVCELPSGPLCLVEDCLLFGGGLLGAQSEVKLLLDCCWVSCCKGLGLSMDNHSPAGSMAGFLCLSLSAPYGLVSQILCGHLGPQGRHQPSCWPLTRQSSSTCFVLYSFNLWKYPIIPASVYLPRGRGK